MYLINVFNSIENIVMTDEDIICICAMMKCLINNECNEQAIEAYNTLNATYKNNHVLCSLVLKNIQILIILMLRKRLLIYILIMIVICYL